MRVQVASEGDMSSFRGEALAAEAASEMLSSIVILLRELRVGDILDYVDETPSRIINNGK